MGSLSRSNTLLPFPCITLRLVQPCRQRYDSSKKQRLLLFSLLVCFSNNISKEWRAENEQTVPFNYSYNQSISTSTNELKANIKLQVTFTASFLCFLFRQIFVHVCFRAWKDGRPNFNSPSIQWLVGKTLKHLYNLCLQTGQLKVNIFNTLVSFKALALSPLEIIFYTDIYYLLGKIRTYAHTQRATVRLLLGS